MLYGSLTVNPISAAWNTVARFDDYADAQQAVDRLSDDGFPVEQVDQHISLARPQRVLPQLDNRVAYGAHHHAFVDRTILVTTRAARRSPPTVT